MRIEISRIIWYSAEGILVWIPLIAAGVIVKVGAFDPKGSLALIVLVAGLFFTWYLMRRFVEPAYRLFVYLYGFGWVLIIKGCVVTLMA